MMRPVTSCRSHQDRAEDQVANAVGGMTGARSTSSNGGTDTLVLVRVAGEQLCGAPTRVTCRIRRGELWQRRGSRGKVTGVR